MTESIWNGFRRLDFLFEGRKAIVVCPNVPTEGNKWLFKTEYFGAFPAFELEMLERGYHVAHVANVTRWCLPEDIDVKARFCEYLTKQFGLAAKCVPVGMSCGGMQAVYFAAKYPRYVAALYLDAPVLNLLSCPCDVGVAQSNLYDEFVRATGKTVSDLINYRDHPIDRVPELIAAGIPVFLVCGDSDRTVPYCENGAVLAETYRKSGGVIEEVLKAGCDHHPHGLEDNARLREFVEKYSL